MEVRIGEITHYYNRIGVAVLDLIGELSVGDSVHIQGSNTNFTQQINSMEIDHQKVDTVGPGAEVAIKVDERVRQGDVIFKVSE